MQARVRRRVPGIGPGIATELRDHVTSCEPPPPFPHRRVASAAGLRPHLTIKIDHALRASAHRAAADEGHSPNIEAVKEGDKVVRLIITCGCGERMEVDCIYPAGS